ncbi:MAG: histidinol-phosphate transaminase [bacterium]
MIEEAFKRYILKVQPYQPGKPIEEVGRELGLSNIVKLASNENPLGPPASAVEAIKDMAGRVHLYPDGSGYHLKRSLSDHLGVGSENIILGSGSDEIVSLVCQGFLGRGKNAVMAKGAFIRYWMGTTLIGAKAVQVPMRDYTHDLKAMAEVVNPRTKVVFVCNPNNPTGTMNTADEVRDLVDRTPENVIIVFDEAYYEYIDDPNYPRTIDYIKEGRENIIVLRTFSKVYGLAGLRIGYGIAHPKLIEYLDRLRGPFNITSVALAAAEAALGDQEHVVRSKRMNDMGRNFLVRNFREMGIHFVPSVANFILFDTGRDGNSVFQDLMREGIIVRPMGGYGFPTFIRVTIGATDENEKLILALKKVLFQEGSPAYRSSGSEEIRPNPTLEIE